MYAVPCTHYTILCTLCSVFFSPLPLLPLNYETEQCSVLCTQQAVLCSLCSCHPPFLPLNNVTQQYSVLTKLYSVL